MTEARDLLKQYLAAKNLTPDDPPRWEALRLLKKAESSPMNIGEALAFSLLALRQNPVRSFLTGLGMVIGTASVILVVTISLTSQNYILEQIEGVGSNMIYASYEVGTQASSAEVNADFIKIADMRAIREELAGRIVAATGIENNYDTMFLNGKEERLLVIGSDEFYQPVRNLVLLAGRFLDASDVDLRQKVALLTEKLAKRLYGSQNAALGQTIKIHGLQFTVIGTFKEKVESFGAIRTEYGNRAHSADRAAVFSARGAHRSAVRAGAFAARCGGGDRAGEEDSGKPPPRRHDLQSRKPHRDSQRREGYFARAERRAGAGFRDRAGDFRYRHHEHHAGHGNGADTRDRRAHGCGSIAARDPAAIPHRSDSDQRRGRSDRDCRGSRGAR